MSRVPRTPKAWRPLLLPIALLLAWDVAVTVVYELWFPWAHSLEIQSALFGSAIALFVGFMVNAAYARWWEARTLWGAVVNSSRTLGRQVTALVDERASDARPGLVREAVEAQVAYVHALRTALRRQPLPPEVADRLTPAAFARVRAAANAPAAVLVEVERLLSEAQARQMIGPYERVLVSQALVAVTDAQGGLERINNTPLPVHYRYLPNVFARVFCALLPFAVVEDLDWLTPVGSGLIGVMFLVAIRVGHELAEPFSDDVHDVPMTALTRTIEIDLTQVVGLASPARVEPVDRVLR